MKAALFLALTVTTTILVSTAVHKKQTPCSACTIKDTNAMVHLAHGRKSELSYKICVPEHAGGGLIDGCYDVDGGTYHYAGKTILLSSKNKDGIQFESADGKDHWVYFFLNNQDTAPPFETYSDKRYVEVSGSRPNPILHLSPSAYDGTPDGRKYHFTSTPAGLKPTRAKKLQGPPVVDADG